MSHTVVHSPIHEAELFLGGEAQHLQSNERLYQAYTQEHANPLSLYIGQDVATLLANPTVQGQIATKLHSTPNLIQIKVTPQRELFVAKTGTTDFQRIDFEEDIAPPEVIAIAEKSQKLYLAMQPSLAPRREEGFDSHTREWSRGYPTPASFSETAQLHERIHSLESQLANERKRTTTALRQELALEKEETARLGAALEEEQVRSSDLLQQKGQVEEQLGLATREVERLGALSRDLTEQLRVSKEDRGRLGREKDQVEEALGRATRKAEQLGEQLHGVTERLRISEETGVALKEEVATLGRRVEDLERENATLLDQGNGAREALASLKHTHGEAEKRLLHVEAELLGERENVQRAEEQSEALRRELSAQKRDLEGQVRDLTAEVREGEKAHGAVTRKLEDAERALKGNQRELQRLDEALRKAQASAKHWEDESRKHDGNHREALVANLELQRQHGLREASLLQEIQLKGTTVSQAQDEFARVSEIARVQGEELVGLQRDLESGRKAFAALQLEHQQALREIDHVGGIAKEQERRVADLEEQLALKKDSLVGAERKIEHVGGIVLKQERQLEELGTELERSREEFNALRLEHSQALEELQAEKEKGRALQTKLEQVNRESLEQFAELNALHEEAQQRLLSENQELTRERDALLKDKDQLEGTLRDSRQEVLRLTSEVAALENANREQESALSAQRETIQDLSGKLARVRREAEERNAAYEKQIAKLSQRLTPLEAQQLREELASQKSAVSRLTEELRLERAKATEALEEVGRRASPQETQKRDETIARLEKELRAASSRSEELDSQLSVERDQRLESTSQHSDEVSLLRKKLKELQASLQAAEKQVEERLAPEAERELRAQLKAQSATSLELTASLEEATREKARAEREVENLTATLESRGSLSEHEIEALRKQLREAEGAAERATQNAAESERRFKEADGERRQLQDEVLLLKRLNAQLQTDADDAVALRKILAEVAMAVGTSEGASALPGIIRKKVAELQEKHTLLERLSDQIIDPMSLARQLDQVELSMLPHALSDRLEEVARLREEHEETLAEVSKKDEEIFSLRQALDEARGSLRGFAETQEALRRRELELEVLTGSAERMEQSYEEQVAALKKEVHTLKASVEERQGVVEEFYDKMVTAEEQRDAAIKQRDTARLAVSEKERTIEEFSSRIDELEEESLGLRRDVEQRGKTIQRQLEELHEQRERLGEQDGILEDNFLAIAKLERVNKARRARLEENEREIEELRHKVGSLREENDRLKLALEHISAVLKVSFTIQDPEELSASLIGRVKEIQASRSQLQEAFDTHTQYLAVAKTAIEERDEQIEELTQTAFAQRKEFESQVQALEKEVHSLTAHLKEARAQVERYDEELRSAHSLNETISESAAKDRALAEGQQKHLVAQIRELEHALQEREIRYEELEGAYRAAREETARLHERIELTQVQRDIQQAMNAGEVMEVLGAALGGDAFSLQLGPGDRALREVTRNHQDYLTIASQLEEMRALAEETAKTKGISLPAAYDLIRTKYYGRHAQHVSSLIAKINSSPGALNKLDLFVDFFKVTGGVSGITRTREFARLTAVRRVLARLHPERDAERIAALNVQTADLTRVLLRNLMGSIYEATKAGSGVTRYNNFGLHLIMWEDILNNLDDSLYVDGDRTKPLKAKDAESLRRTVRQLNVQFHRLMASTHHQTSPGVWAPNT